MGVNLQEILTNNDHFSSFMKHLSAEYSMELLLSLVEFIQFKQMIKRECTDIEDMDDTVTNLATINLASCVPKSNIVFHDSDSSKTKALRLYRKYVRVGSEYEINVCSVSRSILMDLFENRYDSNSDDEWDWNGNSLYSLFDDCCKEMQKLLGYSLSRFKL